MSETFDFDSISKLPLPDGLPEGSRFDRVASEIIGAPTYLTGVIENGGYNVLAANKLWMTASDARPQSVDDRDEWQSVRSFPNGVRN